MHNDKSVEQIKGFMNAHGSFLLNQNGEETYCMRGWFNGNRICLMQDWFDVLNTSLNLAHILDATVSDNKLDFLYITYKGEERSEIPVTITGYNPVCEINDKVFPFNNIYYFESIIRTDDKLVDKNFSGTKDGIIYCVLDLFRLGRLDFSHKRTGDFGYFDRDLKAGKLHTPQFKDTLTIYNACEKGKPENNWYGLWSITKQIPLNRIEFTEKISEKILKKVLTFA